jgi:pimeloyl-ACP methyl ester carboxylesterase
MEAVERRVYLPNCKLHLAIKSWHEDKPQTILAFHGWLDNADTFDTLAPHLEDYAFLSCDFPGHGLSDHSMGIAYHFVDYLAVVWELIAVLDLKDPILLGHSLGASVVSMLAGSCPQILSKLVLLDGLGPLSEPTKNAPERMAKFLAYLHKTRADLPLDPEKIVRKRMEVNGLKSEDAARLVMRNLVEREGKTYWRSDSRLYFPSPYRFTEDQVGSFLAAIKSPTLLLKSESGFFQDDIARARINRVAGIRVREIAAKHHLHLTHPEEVAKFCQDFLGQSN